MSQRPSPTLPPAPNHDVMSKEAERKSGSQMATNSHPELLYRSELHLSITSVVWAYFSVHPAVLLDASFHLAAGPLILSYGQKVSLLLCSLYEGSIGCSQGPLWILHLSTSGPEFVAYLF